MAADQFGLVTTGQLLAAGFDGAAITLRVAAGRLHRLHRGVYAVGHPAVSREGRWLAAVLACGKGAVLSHRDAAALWALLPPGTGPVHVTVSGQGGRGRRRGIRLHRSRTLAVTAVTRHRGIPVTRPARTIADLRRHLQPPELRRAIRQAEVLGLALGEEAETDRTRSELERRFLRLCRSHGLPRPEVNVRVGPFLVDFLWRPQRLIIEVDGYRYHRGRQAFEDDRARDLELRRLGHEVVRLTQRQIGEGEEEVVSAVRALLSRSTDA